MGYLSFSHCNDAFILVWHEKKIGVDIERIDRDFNYEKLARKYFLKSNRSNNNSELNKNSILNQWCAIEAAVKWAHGKLAEDIKEWQYLELEKKILHTKNKVHLNLTQINFYNWTICLALQERSYFMPNILCSSRIV